MERLLFAVVALLVAITMGPDIPDANAWMLTHTYTETGDRQDTFHASYSGQFKVRAKAPTNGHIIAQVKESAGASLPIRIDARAWNSDIDCSTGTLSAGATFHRFDTYAEVYSGTAEANVWDRNQTKIPYCPAGQND